jgi:hypothetical protein
MGIVGQALGEGLGARFISCLILLPGKVDIGPADRQGCFGSSGDGCVGGLLAALRSVRAIRMSNMSCSFFSVTRSTISPSCEPFFGYRDSANSLKLRCRPIHPALPEDPQAIVPQDSALNTIWMQNELAHDVRSRNSVHLGHPP